MDKPLPAITERMTPFWNSASRGILQIQRCDDCGVAHFPARDSCSGCLGNNLVWVEASGRAVLFSYTVMHHVYHPAFADDLPYAVANVKLEEGPLIISSIVDCPPSELTIGMPLEVIFDRLDEQVFLPRFRRIAA